jgi:hypothetical protein
MWIVCQTGALFNGIENCTRSVVFGFQVTIVKLSENSFIVWRSKKKLATYENRNCN